MIEPVTLRAGDWVATVLPGLGGAFGTLDWHGQAVLRPWNGVEDPQESACFPMLPFASRIRDGRIRAARGAIQLPLNGDGGASALHGYGWSAMWHVDRVERHHVGLTLAAGGPECPSGWPWRYEARQTLTLSDDAAWLTLSLHNVSCDPMPAGLGFHPYFPARPRPTLQAYAQAMDESGADKFPVRQLAVSDALAALREGALLPAGLDTQFHGWTRIARLAWPDLRVTLDASEALERLTVYTPAGADYFCIEPVSHAVNALGRDERCWSADGVVRLEPGQSLDAWMRLRPVLQPQAAL